MSRRWCAGDPLNQGAQELFFHRPCAFECDPFGPGHSISSSFNLGVDRHVSVDAIDGLNFYRERVAPTRPASRAGVRYFSIMANLGLGYDSPLRKSERLADDNPFVRLGSRRIRNELPVFHQVFNRLENS